jgi:hypothetical protein
VVLGLVVAIVTIGAACDHADGPTEPGDPASLNGNWAGTITSSVAGQGTLRFSVTEVATGPRVTLNGDWTSTFADSTYDGSGVVGGEINADGRSVTLVLLANGATSVCSSGETVFDAISSVMTVDGKRLAGDYTRTTCDGTTTGHIDVTRL